MAHSEVQFTVQAFLAAQRNALISRPLCPPGPMSLSGHRLQVERIEIAGSAIRHHVKASFSVFYEYGGLPYGVDADGFQTQIAQDLVLHVTELGDIEAHPNSAPATVIAVPVTAVLDVDYYSTGDRCYLRIAYRSLEWPALAPPLPPGVDPDVVKKAAQDLVAKSFPTSAIPFDFANVLTGATKVENAGVTVDTALQRVVFRAQPGGASSSVAMPWSNFFHGVVDDNLDGADWSFFVGSGTLEGIFQNAVWAAVNEKASAELHVVSVAAAYSNIGGTARVHTTIYANVDLPDPLGWKFVTPVIRAELSLGGPNRLTIDVWFPDPADLGSAFIGALGPVLRFILRPVLLVLQGAIQSSVGGATPSIGLPGCAEVERRHLRCNLAVQVQSLGGASANLTSITAFDDGMAMKGDVTVPARTAPAVSTWFTDFGWVPPEVSCGSTSMALIAAFRSDPAGGAAAASTVHVERSGTTPVSLCDVRVINDPLGAYPRTGIRWRPELLDTTIEVRVPNPGPAFAARPYPLDLLVRTTAGTRLVRIPPPPALTTQEIDRLVATLVAAVGNCNQLVAPWFTFPHGFNPKWLVDPPWDGRVDHHWELEVTGLPQGDWVSLQNAAGDEVVRAYAADDRPVLLSALLAPIEGREHEVTVVRSGGRRAGSPGDDAVSGGGGIEVRQQLVRHAATVSLGAACHRLTPWWSRRRVVVAVADGGAEAFNVGDPFLPAMVGSWAFAGLRGAASWDRGLLLFGEEGFAALDDGGRLTPAGAHCDRVDDAVASGSLVYALAGGRLEVRTHRLCPVWADTADRGRSLVRVGRHLVVGGPSGLVAYDLADPTSPRPTSRLDDLDVVALEAVALDMGHDPRAGSITAVLGDGSARLLQVGDGGIQVTATFPRLPWTVGTARLGDTLVRLGPGGWSLDVGLLGDVHAVPPGPPAGAVVEDS